jgi:DUF1009 family protein
VTLERRCLGIIAGGGELPIEIARSAVAAGQTVYVLAVDEFADPVPLEIPHDRKSMGKLGWCIAQLRRRGCRDVVFAGHFKRPRDGNVRLRPDLGGVWFLLSNFGVLRRHNDGIHRAIARSFESRGFKVLSPLAAAPGLAAPEGYLTVTRAPVDMENDFPRALEAARRHGASGQGQAVVFKDGAALATETRAGTDALLRGLQPETARGGLLIKALSPGQLANMDPPAIGRHTVELAAAAGLAGIVLEAGHSVVVQAEAVRNSADKAGLFVIGCKLP